MISLTLEQAKTALECVQNDIFLSEQNACNFDSVSELAFYLSRAELKQRLTNAIIQAEREEMK